MTTNNIIPVKYVFLDVVAYTKRTIEAQCYLIGALNRIVKSAINRYHVDEDSLTYIPTGDGMCIALLGTNLPYAIHVTIAKEILRRIHVNNSRVTANWKKFEVRVGINQCDDNVVTDINGRKNVTGAGINNARRIMDLADASQILVSSTVYENLQPRKEYYHAFSYEMRKEGKHGIVLKIYQLVKPDTEWLNVNPPSSLVSTAIPEPKLPKLTAYYFAHAIKNQKFIVNKAKEFPVNDYWLRLLLYFLAKESKHVSNLRPDEIPGPRAMPNTGSDTIEGHFEWFKRNVSMQVIIDIASWALDDGVPTPMQYNYTSNGLIINAQGKKKLKKDWPEIWNEFSLGELRD